MYCIIIIIIFIHPYSSLVCLYILSLCPMKFDILIDVLKHGKKEPVRNVKLHTAYSNIANHA